MAPIDEQERRELCDLLVELGPDAPTLCEGWTTADLAAHLVIREHFRRWSDERMAAAKAGGYDRLVARLRAGAPLVPWRLPGLRTLLNGMEYVIHHEDVRRANDRGPRPDRPDLDRLFWRLAPVAGRAAARRIRPWSLELRPPGRPARRFGTGPGVTATGPATEIGLWLSGRGDAAAVEVAGAPEALEAVRAARFGV